MANVPEVYHAIQAPPAKSLTRNVLTSLTFWIIVGTIAGILLGEFAPSFSKDAAPLKNVFLRPIELVVFPLVFSSLIHGIAGNKQLKQLARLSIKSFIYFEIVTTLALILGLVAANIANPGSSIGQSAAKKSPYKATNTSSLSFEHWIDHLTPKTWGQMMGGGGSTELLQVLVAAILVGVSTAQLHNVSRTIIVHFAKAVMDMMFKLVNIVIWTAPVGVCFAVANSIAENGMSAMSSLGALILTLYITLILFVVIVFVPIMLALKINPIEFASAMREPVLIGFTTATSEAALPKVFEALDKYGVSPHISAFVVPFGYSLNLDGSTLYLALSAVFCAQAAGVHKSVGEQIVMVLMLMIMSKGVAGVRGASIIVLAASMQQFNIPSWPVTLILGADWFMNMGRTVVNVFGNCLAALVMAKIENEFRVDGWESRLSQHEAPEQDGTEKSNSTHV